MTAATLTHRTPAEIREEALSIASKMNDLRAKESRSDNEADELRSALLDLQVVNAEYDLVGRLLAEERAEKEREENPGGRGPRGNVRDERDAEHRSIGEAFTTSEKYKAFQAGEGEHRSGSVEDEVRTLITTGGNWFASPSTVTGGAGLLRPTGTPQFYGAPYLRPQTFMRDILPSTTTTLGAVPFIKESNFLTNVAGATTVAEGGDKPEVEIDFTTDVALIQKIAAWIPMTWEILQDAPTLRGYIDSFLELALRYREDRQLLSGNGTSPNLKGLFNQSGLQTQAFVSDYFTTVALAFGKIENVQGVPTNIVMNPLDFWSLQATKFTSFFASSQNGSNPAPFGTPNTTIWGVPVTRTTAMATGTSLIMDRRAAMILDRESIRIRVGDQHSDYFTKNKVVVLAEERLGMVVPRPDFMVQAATV